MRESPATRRKALDQALPRWRPRTLAQFLDDRVATYGTRPLLITERGNWTYAAVAEWSRRLAARFAALGVGEGDHVALIMANYAEFVAVKFAVAQLGAILIPVNFHLRGAELHYVLAQADAKLMVTMDTFRGHDYCADLDTVAPGWQSGSSPALPALTAAIVFHTATPLALGGHSTLDGDLVGGEIDAAFPAPKHDPDAASDILYTSGTTGRSKGVVISHDMVLRSAWSSAYHRAFEDGRRIVHALPMYHVFGYVECLMASMWVGGAVIINLLFEPDRFLDLAERHAATDMICLPTMTIKLLEIIPDRGFDSRSLISMFNSGGVNPSWIWQRIRALMPAAEIHTAYGMSETTASATCTLPEDADARLYDSNGRFKLSGCAGAAESGGFVALYKAIDPATGADVPPGETGELVVRGPVVSRGYYGKPEETAAAFTPDGWLRTGDLGRIDPHGYLLLTGRLKETYRCGGEMVTPREIELLLEEHPGVGQALAVGVPHERMGEVGCACIVVADGAAPPEPEALIEMCRARLARFKVPRHILFIAAGDIPLTVTGRPQKHLLVAFARERLAEAALDPIQYPARHSA